MNVAAGIAYIFVDICQEGDHVVADFGFNFEDSFGVKISLSFDFFDCGGGDVAEFGLSLADSDFYLQPAFEFGGFSPDVAHFGQGVALYHGGSFGECDRPIVPLRGDARAIGFSMGSRNRVFTEFAGYNGSFRKNPVSLVGVQKLGFYIFVVWAIGYNILTKRIVFHFN